MKSAARSGSGWVKWCPPEAAVPSGTSITSMAPPSSRNRSATTKVFSFGGTISSLRLTMERIGMPAAAMGSRSSIGLSA